MENNVFVDNENTLLVTHHNKDCKGDHDDYNGYNTPKLVK